MAETVRAASLRGFLALVGQLGGDGRALLEAHGLTLNLSDEERLLPARQVGQLLEATAAALQCPDFGLRLAQFQDIGVLGPIAIAIQNARTVQEALDVVSKYMFVHYDGMSISPVAHADDPGRIALCYGFGTDSLAVPRQSIDLVLAGGHRILTLLGADNYRLHEVRLPYAPIAPLSAYQRIFGAPASFRRSEAALVVPGALMDAPLPYASEAMRAMAADYLQKNFGAGRDDLAARVRMAIAVGLANANTGLDQVARQLSLQPRTLQRRLAAAGEAFDALRDEVMREAALKYLRNPDMPLTEVAARLGLSQQSALTRSCRRWFGESPLKIRRASAQTGAAASKSRPG